MSSAVADPRTAEPSVPATWSVDETTRRLPATLPVFRAFHVDTGCDGGATLVDAARTAGVTLDDLLHALSGTTHPHAGGHA